METTVTYTEEVEKSEKMLLCDDCQRELDDDGSTFVNTDYNSSQEVHYCSECKPSDDSDKKPEHVVRAEEWFDGDDNVGFPVKDNITGARAASASIAILGIAVAAASVFGSEMVIFALGLIILGLAVVSLKLIQDALGVVDEY